MKTTHERLARHFAEQREVPVAGTGVDTVMEQGRAKSRNRAIAMIAGSLALVAVIAVGASALQGFLEEGDRDAEQAFAADGSTESVAALDWRAVESGVGWSRASFAGEDTLYLVSTAPGVLGDGDLVPEEQAIYTSSDGVAWNLGGTGGEMWVSDLTERDGVLYAVGTAPAAGGATEAVVGIQEGDQGAWRLIALPTDFDGTVAPAIDAGSSQSVSIAGQDTLVAAVSTQVWADYSSLLPEGVVSGNYQIIETPEGLRVIDWDLHDAAALECGEGDWERERAAASTTTVMSGDMLENTTVPDTRPLTGQPDLCAGLMDPTASEAFVVHQATWDELGLDGSPSLNEIYVSGDGETFEKVAETGLPDGAILELFTAGDGFVTLARQYPQQTAWYSTDGRRWTELGGLPEMDALVFAGSVDGRIVVGGNRSGVGPLVAAYDDPAGDPRVIDVAGAVGGFGGEVYLPSGAAGNGIAVLAVNVFDQEGRDHTELVTSTDLESWTVTPSTDLVGDRPTQPGEILIRDDGIYTQLLTSDVRPDGQWLPLPVMAIAERNDT